MDKITRELLKLKFKSDNLTKSKAMKNTFKKILPHYE